MKNTKNHKNLSKTPKTTVKPKNHSKIFWIFGVFAIPGPTIHLNVWDYKSIYKFARHPIEVIGGLEFVMKKYYKP